MLVDIFALKCIMSNRMAFENYLSRERPKHFNPNVHEMRPVSLEKCQKAQFP